jgi:hypothetical protein
MTGQKIIGIIEIGGSQNKAGTEYIDRAQHHQNDHDDDNWLGIIIP